MKNKTFKLLLLLFIFMAFPIGVKADDTIKFSLSKSVDSVKSGGLFKVSVKTSNVSDKNTLYDYNLSITFDTNKLEYVGNEAGISNISHNNSTVTVTGKGGTIDSDIELASFDLKTLPGVSGNSNISLTVNSCKVNDDDAKCEDNSTNIKIDPLGTDASLSSLKIPNTTLSPAFSSDVTSYTASITDITELTVHATPTDGNAKVQITDNYKNLQKGENKISVVVVSEDGNNTKTYTINVNLTITPTAEELVKMDATLKNLDVTGQTINFVQTEKKYYLTVENDITELEVKATPNNEKAEVKVEGNKKLIVGKNTITITVTSEDKTKTENYQIIVTRNEQKKKISQTCPDKTSNREWIIFSASLLVTFTLGIVLGYLVCKKEILSKLFKRKKTVETPVEIETFSDTINLDDTVKEVKKEINKK